MWVVYQDANAGCDDAPVLSAQGGPMYRRHLRTLLALTVMSVYAIVLGLVTAPAIMLLQFVDPVRASTLFDWGTLSVMRVYHALAPTPSPGR
jgi:hypothetical protein